MEVNGLKKIFSRSIRLHKLRYNFYIDGDSKSFNEITKLNPYTGQKIDHWPCPTHLRSIKKDCKKKILSEGKGIGGGKGRLTDKVMNTLQNHGMAIRQNTDNLYAMRKAVAAVLHHSTNVQVAKNVIAFDPVDQIHSVNTKRTK